MKVNGKDFDFDNITIEQLILNLELNKDKVVVELNFEIIPKEKFASVILKNDDALEVVSFVGGG